MYAAPHQWLRLHCHDRGPYQGGPEEGHPTQGKGEKNAGMPEYGGSGRLDRGQWLYFTTPWSEETSHRMAPRPSATGRGTIPRETAAGNGTAPAQADKTNKQTNPSTLNSSCQPDTPHHRTKKTNRLDERTSHTGRSNRVSQRRTPRRQPTGLRRHGREARQGENIWEVFQAQQLHHRGAH